MLTPADLSLPEKFTEWRPNQLEMAARVASSTKYAFLLDAPTGSGKSLVAAAVQRLLDTSTTYLCLTKNNTVLTPTGFMLIPEVRLGSRVTVGPNRSERVTALGNKEYDGDVVRITSAYYPCECLEVTPEHEVLVVRGGWSKADISRRAKVMCRADLIKAGDYLVYPAVFGEPVHTSYKDEFIELCAWYVTEGWPDASKRVLFSLGEHETENIGRLAGLIKAVTGREAIIRSPSGSGVVVAMHADREIAEFFAREFGKGAARKKLPQWLFSVPTRQISVFLKAAMRGDGTSSVSHRAVSRTFYYKTVSRTLSYQMRLLAAQSGLLPGIASHYSKNPHNRNDVRPGWLVSYRDSLSTSRGVRGYNDGLYMYLRVMKTQRIPYSGLVYDISVPSQQFCTVSAVVHNCTTKQLQQQLLNDFPYSKTLMGRSNYPCIKYPTMFPDISAEDCSHTKDNKCDLRGRCPYMVAKIEALSAPLAVLNAAYFLSEANYVGGFSNRELLILDELDTIEDQLMSFVEVVITQRQLSSLHVSPPKYKTKFESWVDWARNTLVELRPQLRQIERETEGEWATVDFKALRARRALRRLVSKLEFFTKEVDKTWIWYPGTDRWAFKPVWVSRYANAALWKHTKKVLGMSATILDPRQVSANIGLTLNDRKYDYVSLPSLFPKEHRPVYLEPCANVVNKQMDFALVRLTKAIKGLIDKHPDDHILIHTVSYKIRDYLMKNVESNRLVTHSTGDRAKVLAGFKESTKPLVLISPSMGRGVDLPDEECRVVIIAKVPYADLGDAQVSRRLYGSKDGDSWYAHRAISSVVQMAGRAVRGKDDYAITYILDLQFEKLYREHKNTFPQWFREVIVT